MKTFPAQDVFLLVLKQYINLTFYRFLTRDFAAKHLLLFFANDVICYADDHLMFSFICVEEGNSLFRKLRQSLV